MATQVNLTANTEAQLDGDIEKIDAGGSLSAKDDAYTIALQAGLAGRNALALTISLEAINLAYSDDSLTIVGKGDEIDGKNDQRGLFVYSGKVTIEDLTIENMKAVGGKVQAAGRGWAAGCSWRARIIRQTTAWRRLERPRR